MELNGNDNLKLTHHVTKVLNISDSSLRRWCRELQKHGYKFIVTDDQARVFRQKDIDALLCLQDLVKVQRKKLEDGAREVVEHYSQPGPDSSNPVHPETDSQDQADLLAHKEQILSEIDQLMENLNGLEDNFQGLKMEMKSLITQVAEQEQTQEMDRRDKELMIALREIRDGRHSAAAGRQKKWWRFWA